MSVYDSEQLWEGDVVHPRTQSKKTIEWVFVLPPHEEIKNGSKRHSKHWTKEFSSYETWALTLSTWKPPVNFLPKALCRKRFGLEPIRQMTPVHGYCQKKQGEKMPTGSFECMPINTWKYKNLWKFAKCTESIQIRWQTTQRFLHSLGLLAAVTFFWMHMQTLRNYYMQTLRNYYSKELLFKR